MEETLDRLSRVLVAPQDSPFSGFLPASATAVSVDSRPGTSGVLPPSSGVPLEPDFTSERVSSDPQLFGANSMAPSWAR